MHKHLIITLLLLLSGIGAARGQNTYNFNRGVEEFDNGNYEAAMRLFVQELERNDEDPGSWYYIAVICDRNDQLGNALTAVNNCIKYTSPKEKTTLAMAHHLRSSLYRQLGDTVAELADLDMAVRCEPKNATFLKRRGDYHYYHQDYTSSDEDFNRMLSLDRNDAYAMIALARNAEARKQYDKSVEWCTRAIEADPEMSAAAHQFRSDGYMGLNDYDHAAADLVDALEALNEDTDWQLFDRMYTLADSAFTPLAKRLKEKMTTNPDNENWIYALGTVAIRAGYSAQVLPELERAAQGADDSFINGLLARCLHDLGDYDRAIAVKRLSIERDSTDTSDFYGLAGLLKSAGRCDEALAAIDSYIEKEPGDGDGYSLRADICLQAGRHEQAIDDYNTAIVLLEPGGDSSSERYKRGALLDARGDHEAARADWRYVIESDSTGRLAALAWQRLGDTHKAQQLIDDYMAKKESPAARRRTLWVAADLQALQGRHEQAVDLLRQACRCGAISPAALRSDIDLAGLHGNADFEHLVESQNQPTAINTQSH